MGKITVLDIINVAKEFDTECFEYSDINKELEVSTDSRDDFNNADKVFIALKGDKFDGNNFALDVYNLGCRFFILSNRNIILPKDAFVIYCNDTILFLIRLAREYRRKFNIKVVLVTGSCGKTTTKELISLFLSTKYKVLKTEGNLNNEIGVPKTIFNLDSSYDIAVIEAGMNHRNELLRISEATESDTVVINNVEEVHIAYLGSLENIALAKSETLYNTQKNASLIISKDIREKDTILKEANKNNIENIIEYDIADIIKIDDSTFKYKNVVLNHNLIGDFNLKNILTALKVAELYNINLEDVSNILQTYKNQKNRMEIFNINGTTIINDCYNSNPVALKNMLIFLSKRIESKKIAIIGDMLETEMDNTHFHRDIGLFINELKNVDVVIACGECSKDIYDIVNSEKYYFKSVDDELLLKIKSILTVDTAILIKASFGVGFAKIIDYIKEL